MSDSSLYNKAFLHIFQAPGEKSSCLCSKSFSRNNTSKWLRLVRYLRKPHLCRFRLPQLGKSKWLRPVWYLRKPGSDGYSEVCGLPPLAFSTAEKEVKYIFGGTWKGAGTPEMLFCIDFGCLYLRKASGCGLYGTSESQGVVVIRRYAARHNLPLVPLKSQ